MEDQVNRSQHPPDGEDPGANSAWRGAALMVGVIAGFYLLREHWWHALGLAPYLLLLACPLVHVFMHGSHGHHHQQKDKERP